MKQIFGNKMMAIWVIASLVLVVVPAQFIQADEHSALTYLASEPADDWSVQSLVAAGQTVADQTFLQPFTATDATAIEKRILTLVALGHDPKNYYAGRDLVLELKTEVYTDQQLGASSFLNDDFWGLLALASVKDTSNLVFTDSVRYVLDHQNSDGGWSYALNNTSDTNDTAVAVMALLEAKSITGVDQAIEKALTYLQSAQNSDGGWGFTTGSVSDTASTAWVVSAMTKANKPVLKSTIDFLWAMQSDNGSFKWVASDTNGSVYMTAQGLLALSQKYFPVAVVAELPRATGVTLRIEGDNHTHCTTTIAPTDALEAVKTAADICGYTFQIQQTSFGPYLQAINTDQAAGTKGWQYRVNGHSPQVGAQNYSLIAGDELLWYYGEFTLLPLRLEGLTDRVGLNDSVIFKALSYSDATASWVPAAGVVVTTGAIQQITDSTGITSISFNTAGQKELWASGTGFIKSNVVTLMAGSGVSQSVGWQVNVDGSNAGTGNPEVSFSASVANVNFGTLTKGAIGQSELVLTNDGSVPVYLEAIVNGNHELIQWLKINNTAWEDYNVVINTGSTQQLVLSLIIPGTFSGTGKYTGDIIFWGTAAD